jgi:hypothetical protein
LFSDGATEYVKIFRKIKNLSIKVLHIEAAYVNKKQDEIFEEMS